MLNKRVTLFIGSLTGGGAERVTCNLANYLANKNFIVEVITMSDVDDKYKLDDRVKKISLINASERKNVIYDAILRYVRLGSYMKTQAVDCYVVMLPITIAMMLLQKRKTNAKIVASERNDPASYSPVMQRVQKWLAKRADGYVFQTEDAETWYGDAVNNCKTEIIPNAINQAFIREPYDGDKRKVIAGTGRLKDQKNFPLLIRAFAKIADAYPDYTLTIYGQGEKENDLKKQVADFKLANRVCFPGNVQNIAEEMEKNAMFVLSSDFEGMPNALMEAMALGLPCVATDCPVGGPRYLIQNGENGLLVPVKDADALAKAMRYLLAHAEEMKCMGECARNITKKLSPDKIYGEWESFVYSVIHK